MYFLNDEEKRLVLRRLLPQSRTQDVDAELRGWSWHQPPLSPIYDVRLGIHEIANRYCPNGRDVYLRRVLGVKAPPNLAMAEGGALHSLVCELILRTKRIIYNHGTDCVDALRGLREPDLSALGEHKLSPEDQTKLEAKARVLWSYEHDRIMARVQDVLARQPWIGPDSLVALALPVTVEQKLDGTFLGLSPHLSADAFVFSEPMLVDVKFGTRRDFHRLSTAGYALVMESVYEFPVNVGCIVYVTFEGNRLQVERDFHFIGDELRQWFVEQRDATMRMVQEEIDPKMPPQCQTDCHYYGRCRG